jgi:hypothetical protein
MPRQSQLAKRSSPFDSYRNVTINFYDSPSPSPSSVSSSTTDSEPVSPPASAGRYNPYGRPKERSPTQKDTLPVPDPLVNFKIDFTKFPHQTVTERLVYVKSFLDDFSPFCIFHLLIKSKEITSDHDSITTCDFDLGLNSEYRDVFRSNIIFESASCFRCGCSLAGVLQHGKDWGKKCKETSRAESIKPIPYLTLNSPQLRPLVFDLLGIKPDYFLANNLEYGKWLGKKSVVESKYSSNLMEIVYVTAWLLRNGRIPKDTSFVFPGKSYLSSSFLSLTFFINRGRLISFASKLQ